MTRRIVISRLFAVAATALFVVLMSTASVYGKTDPKKGQRDTSAVQGKGKSGSTIQRVPTQPFEVLQNTVSDIQFYSSNYGIFGLDVARSQAGGIWPRGSGNAYIFGGGIWFGTQKHVVINGQDSLEKMVVYSYNPNSGASQMAPGYITEPLDQSSTDNSAVGISKYRMYFSTDYNNITGEPFDAKDKNNGAPNWPLWDTDPDKTLKDANYAGYTGRYIEDINQRNTTAFPKGPAFISQEDIFSLFKDTDLSRYAELGPQKARSLGYPLGVQIEQTIYTWGFGLYRNFMFIRYNIINRSKDTLRDCWMAPVMDMDIGNAANDHNTIAIPDKSKDTLNFAIQWSETEGTKQYGYLGCDFLESPAVDAQGFLRKDKLFYKQNEQLGLKTFRTWILAEDPNNPELRYNFMSSGLRNTDNGAGDKRFMMATGSFSMRPGDTARVVIGIMFAYGNGAVPTGQEVDRGGIYAIDTFAQGVYDLNFAAPVPPDPCNASWRPLNNGVEVLWDTTSEATVDLREGGLDFLGYRIQRFRKAPGYVTTDSIHTWNLVPKTIASFACPPMPDSAFRAANLLGPWYRLPQLAYMDSSVSVKMPNNAIVVGASKYYQVSRIDTVKRPGLSDTLVKTLLNSYRPVYSFRYNPYNDADTAVRRQVRQVIYALMDSVTGGRRFVDVGDDNKDGSVLENAVDLSQNERLINNTDYYYNVLAYDAGSVEENTPTKTNTAILTKNQIKATPEAPPASAELTPTLVSQSGLGGIYNFRLDVLDKLRMQQLFAGDTIEFEFNPYVPDATKFGAIGAWYMTEVTVRNKKTNSVLMKFVVNYDANMSDRADFSYRNLDSTLATYTDTNSLGIFFKDKRGVRSTRNGTYQADPARPLYNTVGIYQNTFTPSFDYNFQQFGDSLRFGMFGDTVKPYKEQLNTFERTSTQSDAALLGFKQLTGQTGRETGASTNADTFTIQTRVPSIVQPKLEIEFLPGGIDPGPITYRKSGKLYEYRNVPYLTMKVRNVASYEVERFDPATNSIKKETIQYNYTYPEDPLAQSRALFPPSITDIGRTITPGMFGIFAYGWQDTDTLQIGNRLSPIIRSRHSSGTTVLGTTNRYYLGSTAGTDSTGVAHTLKFTHKLAVNGAEIMLDFAGMGTNTTTVLASQIPAAVPQTDFKAGDKITVNFTGGALGLPQPGAKVLVAIPDTKLPVQNMTDEILNKVTVVPNPYLVSHIGQVSNTDRKVYFTQLPSECTIQIYTEAGELLQTLTHQASAANGPVAVDAWDLITRGGRQAQSQLLIARITTPNGAEAIKKFSVVVGGFRIISR